MTDYLKPYSKKWFEVFEKFNGQQAAHTRQIIDLAKKREGLLRLRRRAHV